MIKRYVDEVVEKLYFKEKFHYRKNIFKNFSKKQKNIIHKFGSKI